MLEGETTQKRGNLKNFFLHPKPAAPPGPGPFDSSLSAENQELSPHQGSSFPCFQPTMKAPPHEENLYFCSSPATPESRGGFSISCFPEQWVETRGPQPFGIFFFSPAPEGEGGIFHFFFSLTRSHHQPCPSHRHFPCHFSLPPSPPPLPSAKRTHARPSSFPLLTHQHRSPLSLAASSSSVFSTAKGQVNNAFFSLGRLPTATEKQHPQEPPAAPTDDTAGAE